MKLLLTSMYLSYLLCIISIEGMENHRELTHSLERPAPVAQTLQSVKKHSGLGSAMKRILRSSMREIATEFLLGSFELFSYIPHCVLVTIRGCNRMWHRYYYGVNAVHPTEVTLYSQHIHDLVMPLLACGQHEHKQSRADSEHEKLCLSSEQRHFFVTRLQQYSEFVINTLRTKRMHYAMPHSSFSEQFKKFSPTAWKILVLGGASSAAYIFYQAYTGSAANVAANMAFQLRLRESQETLNVHPATITTLYSAYPYITSGYTYASYALVAGLLLYLVQSKLFVVPRPQEIIFHIDEIIATLLELQHAVCVPAMDNARVHCLLKGVAHGFHQLSVLAEQGPLFDVPLTTEK